MLDNVLKVIALAGLAATLAPLAIKVPDVDLIAVLAVVMAMAVFDFLVRPYFRGRRQP
jgi:hypothetical protein